MKRYIKSFKFREFLTRHFTLIQFTDMGKLIRFIYQGIKHFFIVDGEYLGDGCNEFKNRLPDSFADSQFVAVLSHLPEEFANSLVVHEALHGREYVVLECHEGRACNLRSKVCRLAFAKPEQSLAFLEDDFLRPASGVNPVCLEETKRKVCRKQSAPWASLAATDEEQADMSVCEDNISTDIPALEFAAVFLLAPLVQLLDNGRGGKVLALETVFGLTFLTDLYHPDIIALDMAGTDETDNPGTCKPAVCQYIAETDFVFDGPANHLDGEINLAHGVLIKTGMDCSVFVPFCGVSFGELLFAHSIVALPAFLSEDGKVEKHLADAIGNAEEESLEAKDAAVLEMGVDTSDVLHASACLGEVRIVNHQTGIIRLVITSNNDLCPKLAGNMVHQLAPVGAPIVEELIEHIFTTTELAA